MEYDPPMLTNIPYFLLPVKPNATQDEIDDIIDADDQSPIFAQSVRGDLQELPCITLYI